ncbi:MAG: hypothetical protein P8168_11590 [Deltaproteobacteria bacterium]|jgi:hypothetical protein
MRAIRVVVLVIVLLLCGCAPRFCWYDKTRGPGAPYEDAEGSYYLGLDYASGRYYKIRGSNPLRNPYVYQPGSASWTRLYRWTIYRPYIFPKCRR